MTVTPANKNYPDIKNRHASHAGKSSEAELPALPFVVAIDSLAGRCNQFATAKTLIARAANPVRPPGVPRCQERLDLIDLDSSDETELIFVRG